jgi:hypothetical protein
MKYTRRPYKEQDFLKIRDFLKNTMQTAPAQKNWMIDRWTFGRYFGHVMHGTFNTCRRLLASGKMKIMK